MTHRMTDPSPDTPTAQTGIAAWRVLFRMLAGFLALFVFAFWAAAGWNRGWTKTSIPVKRLDEVTGIEFVTYQDHFAPGVELLSLGLFVSVAIFAATFLRRRAR